MLGGMGTLIGGLVFLIVKNAGTPPIDGPHAPGSEALATS